MASTVLPNGIIIPEKYSRDWYADLYHNWQELDNLLGGGTPKDGTLTIQKNGATVGTFSANQATNETINITVPTVNNATLTIQQNGTTVDTFTANSSTDKTVDITVPTKTSDLTNDSGFITEDTTKIPLAGSNAISGSLIPSTDGTVNLGGPSYQWNNAYIKSLTINGVACGDILTHNASEFVDLTSDQIISGLKSFQDVGRYYIDVRTKSTNLLNFRVFNIELDSNTNLPTKGYTFAQNVTSANPALYLGYYYSVTAQGLVGTDIRNYKYGSNKDYAGIIIKYALNDDNYISIRCNRFVPNADNATALGSTAYKWADVNTNLINGINPGALSLPSSTYIDVDTTNWDLTCQNELMGSFTPTADGWLMLHVANSGTSEVNFWVIGGVIRINNKSTLNTSDNNNFNMITIPVEKDVTYNIYGNASEYAAGRSIAYCRFMPCRGNV